MFEKLAHRLAVVGPLRVMMAATALVLIVSMAFLLVLPPTRDLYSVALRSVVPSLGVLTMMVLLFDMMMLIILGSSKPSDQRILGRKLLVVWAILSVTLVALFVAILA